MLFIIFIFLATAVPPLIAQEPPPGLYVLDFSQIGFGGTASSGGDYSVEDVIRIASSGAKTQQTPIYTFVNPLDPVKWVNNGLAINQGTGIRLLWSDGGAPAGSQGYNVYRRNVGMGGDYTKINTVLILVTEYEDDGLSPATYSYIVYLIDANGQSIQWTSPIEGTVVPLAPSDPLMSETWMLYE